MQDTRAAEVSRRGVEGLVRKDIFGGRSYNWEFFEEEDVGRWTGSFCRMVIEVTALRGRRVEDAFDYV